jgi:hypothetical protein
MTDRVPAALANSETHGRAAGGDKQIIPAKDLAVAEEIVKKMMRKP